ncbi:MAG: hypothetical protein HZA12_05800 [Nitrospirae bacterium]|nr:hypothetical protein [Nitrospirota bacterium]
MSKTRFNPDHRVITIDLLIESIDGSGIEGLLGLNFLRYFELIIKFPKGTIELNKIV